MRSILTLAHLSDPHLGPLPRAGAYHFLGKRLLGYLNWHRRRHFHLPEALAALVADLREQPCDHIAVTGDLVNLALPAEFSHALAWLRCLGDPADVSVIPGNHDAYVPLWRAEGARLWADYMRSNEAGAAFADQPGARFPYVRLLGDVALIGTSSARPTAPLVAAGRLGRAQIERLDRILAALGERKLARVLMVHHPPLPGMGGWRRGLHDARALCAVLRARGVELVLHGHEHRFTLNWLDGPQAPIPIVGAPSASAAPSQTKVAHPHAKPPASYHLYRIAPSDEGCVIEMTRRGLIDAGSGVGTLEQVQLSPQADTANSGDFLGENA